MKAHNTEKPLSSPKELEPGAWCECYFDIIRQIYLHPFKDELFVIRQAGQLGRWRYTPELTYVDGYELAEMRCLRFSPDGEWFVILLPSLGRIEIRSTDDLSCLRQIQKEFIYDESSEMCLSQDGRWLVLDACKNYDKRGAEDGAAWIDLQTGETIFRTWEEMNNNIKLEDEYATFIGQMKFSPDQKQLAVNIWYDCYISEINFFKNLHHKDQRIEETPLSYWIAENISDFCYHADSTRMVCFKTMKPGDWKFDEYREHFTPGWLGELIALSTTHQEELWRVTIDASLTGWEQGVVEGNYEPYGYGAKVLVGETEVVCTAPGGQMLFFDMENGTLKRKMKVNGNYIYAIGWHRDGDKIRVATDQELQVIEWK
ncbi:hypothetical protein [Laceyella sacchari]|uniref:WD40 repeat protein n=1 Tax=Laceyella sacchari TaxID=37482 RepID=A0ABY5U6I6_LACSH|nr:hypothetical protein [Laceyella sacchari]UWE04235.1 hypothetical protein NYR52_03480 [Laceyella sacchari]